MSERKLKHLQTLYPHIKIKILLAYMPKRQSEAADYCDTVFPEEIAASHPKYSIIKRNEWMLNRADAVITYVRGVTGGAAKFKQLAEKKGKRVINIADME